jgi:hypothetical protein
MSLFASIWLGLLYTVFAEGIIFRIGLGRAGINVWAKVFFLNVVSFIIAISIAITGYFSLGWHFVTSWGMAQWFLLIIACEFLPMSILFGELGFRRVFTLLVFANMASSLFLCFIIVYIPQALMIPSMEMKHYEYQVVEGIGKVKDALESYYVNKGEYPAYIYGGDHISWRNAGESLDPLLKEGYLDSYPVNVYHLGRAFYIPRRRGDFTGFFWGLEGEKYKQLKKTWSPVVEEDPRFGFHGTKMGNILSLPYVPASIYWHDYHVYRGSKEQQFFLPGAFLYKSFDMDMDGRFDSYILAGFGSEEDAGMGMDIYNQSEDKVTYMVGGKLVAGKRDRKKDGVIVVETGGFKTWWE